MVQMSDVLCSTKDCGNVAVDDIRYSGMCSDCHEKDRQLAEQEVGVTYTCAVSPVDTMYVYKTVDGCGKCIALVMSNHAGQKISVLLTRDDAIRLQNQFNDFIINN